MPRRLEAARLAKLARRGLMPTVVACLEAGCAADATPRPTLPPTRPQVVRATPPVTHDAPRPPTTTPEASGTAPSQPATPPDAAVPIAASDREGARVTSPAEGSACAEDMVLVEGKYCPTVVEECLEHTADYAADEARRSRRAAKGLKTPPSSVPERCLHYRSPTTCLAAERVPMRFCMDRYEWPNRRGALPMLAVTGYSARQKCEAVGKRLCDADEFTFACEGEALLPYSYGYDRDPQVCNIDRPYVVPRGQLLPHDLCLNTATCKAELARLDQREPSGARPRCASPFGVMDINGNVNEWVNRPGERAPWRAGLKGGWWGPARSRCRPMVTAHNEHYIGYEVGFRCCRDADAPPAAAPSASGAPATPAP